ncbi:MAG: ATPase, partial [bacterium]
MPETASSVPAPAPALGLDAGGSATRWALAAADGTIVAEGSAPPLSGVQLLDAEACARLGAVLDAIAADCPAAPRAAWAGVSGLDAVTAPAFAALVARSFGLPAGRVHAAGDIELLCRAAGAPGRCIVLYAGTGSIAAALQPDGTLQR